MESCAETSAEKNRIRIAVVVGEASGDVLGAGLMRELKKLYPNARFEGIGGPRMLAEGFETFFPQDRLAVMGLVEPLARLPELLGIRKFLKNHFLKNPPSVFIGIDSPAFNTGLELSLREKGIKTTHYVSPSVWAWRQGRIKKIAKAVDLMLTLLPFEAAIYRKHQIPVKFVGHPLADEIALVPGIEQARETLGLTETLQDKHVIALLPGSRTSEVERLASLFLDVARKSLSVKSNLHFLVPSANEKRHQFLQDLIDQHGAGLPLTLVEGQSHLVMEASDAVLMASGTTTLEAMLLKKPMVIVYKLAPLSYWLFKKLVKVKYIGLPNLLAQKALVPELIQERATVDAICKALLPCLNKDESRAELIEEFRVQHLKLKQNASVEAAKAIKQLIEKD